MMGDSPEDVEVSVRDDGETLPLIVRPKAGRDAAGFLQSWIAGHTKWIDRKLLEHGAILFRGFRVRTGSEFQEALQRYVTHLSDEYRGTSPRKLIEGTQYVFSASELPPSYPIPQHLEMSFLPAPPRKLFFCCLEAPTSAGGETCLCDFKKVYEQLDPVIRAEFEEKKVLHSRYYTRSKTGWFSDPTKMKGWEDVFGTGDKERVEAELRETGQDFHWEGEELSIVNQQPATETHPETGEKIWFNHTLVFHYSMLSHELYRVYQRVGALKYWLFSWLLWFLKILLLTLRGPSKFGFHTFFGDGSAIPESHLKHLHDVVWDNMVFNRWEEGDILMIDNFRISHGRQPYAGRRKIVVSWSHPHTKPSFNK